MSVLKIKGADGNFHSVLTIQGKDYIITEADYEAIAEIAAKKNMAAINAIEERVRILEEEVKK